MSWLFTASRWYHLALAIASPVAFVIALVAGLGLQALAFVGAAIWWLLFSRYWAGKAQAADRHRELRRRRLERECKGLAPPRGSDHTHPEAASASALLLLPPLVTYLVLLDVLDLGAGFVGWLLDLALLVAIIVTWSVLLRAVRSRRPTR